MKVLRDEYCIFEVNYTVALERSLDNATVELQIISSESCEDGICSMALTLSPSEQIYRLSVSAVSDIGSSKPAMSDYNICKDTIGACLIFVTNFFSVT